MCTGHTHSFKTQAGDRPDHAIVLKPRQVIDPITVPGHWVIGSIDGSVIEPHEKGMHYWIH